MKSIPWGVVVFVCVFVLRYWRIWKDAHAVLDEPYDPLIDTDDVEWTNHDLKPDQPGTYQTRVYGRSNLHSDSTVWNGQKWTYSDGEECYFQARDWRALPGSVTP